MKLISLKASSLRGIPRDWPEVEIGDRGIVVYGSNGVGKSSIIDAIEFIITEKSTLYSENRTGVNWQQGAPHVRGGPISISLAIKADDGITYEISTGKPLPQALIEWTKIAKDSTFVLRRYMMLKFVNAQPRSRYEILEHFLDLKEYVQIESELQRVANEMSTRNAQISSDLSKKEGIVRRIFALSEAEAISPETLILKLNTHLLDAGIPECEALVNVGRSTDAIIVELGDTEHAKRLAKLGGLKSRAQHLTPIPGYRSLLDSLVESVRQLDSEVASVGERAITSFLIEGKKIIQDGELVTCPLCEQAIESPDVLCRLDERIAKDERLTKAKQLVEERTAALRSAITEAAKELDVFLEGWRDSLGSGLPEEYEEASSLLSEFLSDFEGGKRSAGDVERYMARFAAAPLDYGFAIKALDARITSEGGGSRRQALEAAKNLARGIDIDYPLYLEAKEALARAGEMKLVAERIHGHAVEARKVAVQNILRNVDVIANEMYDKIHPDEGLARAELSVRATGEGSVNLQTDFYGRAGQPLLYYSEGHLDTLGLCYFLALRKKESFKKPGFKLLVLDDVLHSIDADHRARVGALLKTEFGDHQIVLVTHDRYFYDRLRAGFGEAKFKYLAIVGWDIDRGPICGDPSTDLDRVVCDEVRSVTAADVLAAAAGRFFEWMARQLDERLEVAVVARFERKYDIGALWPPLAKKLQSRRSFKEVFPNVISDIEMFGWVRNAAGAHSNESASAPGSSEARNFAKALADLYHATHCECGSFVRKIGNGSWVCDCGNLVYRS